MMAGIPISIPSVLLGYYFYENYPYTNFSLKIVSLFYKLGFERTYLKGQMNFVNAKKKVLNCGFCICLETGTDNTWM